jgi:hypothetical protein
VFEVDLERGDSPDIASKNIEKLRNVSGLGLTLKEQEWLKKAKRYWLSAKVRAQREGYAHQSACR